MAKPHVLVLGGNFAGLTAARFIREFAGDAVDLTVIDRKPYLLFVPNIPLEVLANQDPAEKLHMPIVGILNDDDIRFIPAEVNAVDVVQQQVTYTPNERPGAATEHIHYDLLVFALGALLDYESIEGFAEYGHTVSDSYYGNELRDYLFGGAYRGGPIAIGSARFVQGTKGRPSWLPNLDAACEGPPLEMALALSTWLQDRDLGGPEKITLFTPGEVIAEDAGKEIVDKFLEIAAHMGIHYRNETEDIRRVTQDGIEFANGGSLEAELKIILPNWVPLAFMRELPIADEVGFVVTDLTMRNPDYPNVFAVGDCAALTVPKLGAIGDQQARIVGRQIAKDVGRMSADEADQPFDPVVVCFGDMGDHKGFYIHSNTWFGGDISELRMGYLYYAMKIGFKEMYYRTGGKPPAWGLPLAELVSETL